MIKTQVSQAFNDYRLDKYLCQKFDISFAVAQKIIREKKIKINGQKLSNCERIYLDDKIEIFANLIDKEKELIQAELSLINSTASYNIAQAELAYNMGIIDVKNILGTI